MNFFYIVSIIGTVIFLITSIMVVRTLKKNIANGFELEDENDLRWHVIALSVGSFVFLFLLALLYAIFCYLVGGAEYTFIMFLTDSMIFYPIAMLIIAFGLPIQALGVVYSFVYFKSSEKKVKPTIYIALALASSLAIIALIVRCVRVFAFWCL